MEWYTELHLQPSVEPGEVADQSNLDQLPDPALLTRVMSEIHQALSGKGKPAYAVGFPRATFYQPSYVRDMPALSQERLAKAGLVHDESHPEDWPIRSTKDLALRDIGGAGARGCPGRVLQVFSPKQQALEAMYDDRSRLMALVDSGFVRIARKPKTYKPRRVVAHAVFFHEKLPGGGKRAARVVGANGEVCGTRPIPLHSLPHWRHQSRSTGQRLPVFFRPFAVTQLTFGQMSSPGASPFNTLGLTRQVAGTVPIIRPAPAGGR